jgi:hypothetical protein
MLFVIILLCCQTTQTKAQLGRSPASLKSQLRQEEARSPLSYVSTSNTTWSVNLVSNTVIKGYLHNAATVSGFKNITLRAIFKTKTGSYVAEEEFTVLEFLPPGGSVDFRRTIDGYWKDASRMSIQVISAEPY